MEGQRELEISVVPDTPPREVLSTIVGACRALIYAMVGARGLLGLNYADVELIADEFEAARWDEKTEADAGA